MTARPLSRSAIFAQAWPIILGQTTVPLVGLADTVVIGRTGDAAALAGVALGTTVINFLFWTFGFLRMGMTGMTAQAQGADDEDEVRAMLIRGLVLGLAIGSALFVLQWLLIPAAFALLAGGEAIDASAKGYVAARFWGAPASLAVFAINGWLLGLGRTRAALVLQIVMNLINVVLDILFVWKLDMGAAGVGLGTALAEWSALVTGLVIAARVLGPGMARSIGERRKELFTRPALRRLFAVNANIMIRTVALLMMFAWFANAGARLGTVPLAANQVMMQFVSVSAFVLDGFAFTAESRIGGAIGRGSRDDYLRAIRLTGEFTLAAGLLFAGLFFTCGDAVIDMVTNNEAVRDQASALLPLTALVPLIGAPAWLFDGIFIGATRGASLRNAALVSTCAYILTDLALRPAGAQGVWIALLAGYGYRALALGCYLPALTRSIAQADRGA
ncbi:MATE family efflux transporter [Stakelama sp. CBK3Z-3]|uniref:MATE family efflux transporter n=1 Tax=Stakelama flava TaxID=2860338 RepID=A0ABS6XM23_9SPHN|nr:MATE family efflux transporter [Stakelama flava]MBW4331265.1 MATE family efflux transporter [Stakelama flava]